MKRKDLKITQFKRKRLTEDNSEQIKRKRIILKRQQSGEKKQFGKRKYLEKDISERVQSEKGQLWEEQI